MLRSRPCLCLDHMELLQLCIPSHCREEAGCKRLLPELPAPSLGLQLHLPSKCPSVAMCSAANGWCRYRHLVSFMSLYGTRSIINNNILPDDYCMTAVIMNHSGRSNNHEQIEKQTKKQSVVLHLKINLRTQRDSSGVEIFC